MMKIKLDKSFPYQFLFALCIGVTYINIFELTLFVWLITIFLTLKNKYYFFNFVLQWNSIYDAGVLFGYEGKTSGIKNLLFESFVSSHYTAIPPIELAEKFYDFMKPIQIKKEKNLKENQELASLRDWLLPMLMNGQVTVGDINESIENKKESILNSIDKIKGYSSKEQNLGMVAEDKVEYKKG